MKHFSGTQYLKIDIANTFGLDRLNWDDRLHWFENNEPVLEDQAEYAKNPILFRKAVRAMREVQKGRPTNHIMGLDATASGIQILAALSGCHDTARAVNLINTGNREDVYQDVSEHMNTLPGIKVDRDTVKQPVMTVFYGSIMQPQEVFGTGDTLVAFYEAMETKLKGAYQLMKLFQKFWNPAAEYHQWTLPDGHIARVPVIDTLEKNLELDEADHLRFTYRTQVISPKTFSKSMAANIVHSVDGWICRKMVEGANKQGYSMAPIHDCFYASPNNMNQVRQNYVRIMEWLANSDVTSRILTELSNKPYQYRKLSSNLGNEIAKSDYALS